MAEPSERQRTNLELTRAAFGEFTPESAEAAFKFLSPEVEVYSTGNLANSGTFHGHDGYITWIGRWLEAWDDFQIEVTRIEPVGERHVVISAHQTAKGKGSGVPVEMDVAFLAEVEDELAVAFQLHEGRDAAVAVAEEREQAANPS